jgi:hypothetical protein
MWPVQRRRGARLPQNDGADSILPRVYVIDNVSEVISVGY